MKIKKLLAIVLVMIMVFTFAACGSKDDGGNQISSEIVMDDYSDYTLSDYVKLPDYNSYEGYAKPEVTITDENIDTEIQTRLDKAGTTEESKEGTVDKGDTINIEFHGYLSDGSTQDGMNTDSTQITLGNAGYIEGFEEGLYGTKVGDTVTIDLAFPDPYDINPELSGEPVQFVVTVLSKVVPVPAEYNDEFIKTDSNGAAADDASYRTFLHDYLYDMAMENALYEQKNGLYQQLLADTTEITPIDEKVAEAREAASVIYNKMAGAYGVTIDEFVKDYLQLDDEGYAKFLDEYANTVVKNRMVVFAFAQAEGVQTTEEEYHNSLENVLAQYNTDEEGFESSTGVSLSDYAEMYSLLANLTLETTLDKVYNRMIGE